MIKFTKAWSPGISSATYYIWGINFSSWNFKLELFFMVFIFMVNLYANIICLEGLEADY